MTVIPVVVFVTVLSGISTYRLVRKTIVSSVRQMASGEAVHLSATLTSYFNEQLEDMGLSCRAPCSRNSIRPAPAATSGVDSAAPHPGTGVDGDRRAHALRQPAGLPRRRLLRRRWPSHPFRQKTAPSPTQRCPQVSSTTSNAAALDLPVENTGPARPVFKAAPQSPPSTTTAISSGFSSWIAT